MVYTSGYLLQDSDEDVGAGYHRVWLSFDYISSCKVERIVQAAIAGGFKS
ncbi:hypothetical protein [Prevotella jejuni]